VREVIDAWIQPWTSEVVAGIPERNWELARAYGNADRLMAGITIEQMVAEMDAAGVGRALCSAGPLIPNEIVLEAVKTHPDRLVGVASVDPWGVGGVMGAVRELRRLVEDHGFKGLKLEPFINDRVLTEPRWYPLYAACVDLGITLQTQVGNTGPPTYPSETGRPLYVDRIAVEFPDLRIVAGHIGWPWTDEMIAVASKHPNVWIDTSAYPPKRYPPEFGHFLRTWGRRKAIWASDWPILDFDRALAGIDELDLTDEVRRGFLHDNAVAAFALEDPA
jgi:predicted TIM-barrel fold metal-dependent hydrolase